MGLRVAWRNVIALNSKRKRRSRQLNSSGFPLHNLNDSLWTFAHTLAPYILFHTCSLSPSPFPGLQFLWTKQACNEALSIFEVRIIRFIILFSCAVSREVRMIILSGNKYLNGWGIDSVRFYIEWSSSLSILSLLLFISHSLCLALMQSLNIIGYSIYLFSLSAEFAYVQSDNKSYRP